jgi:hypothetical protein
MTDDTEKLEWPERMYLLHPSVKTFGDMISIPERQEYVHADQIRALEAQRDGFQQEAENYINLLGKALAERDAALERRLDRAVAALRAILGACDQGRMIPRPGSGAGGMTVEANILSSIYTGVPAWPIEATRALLAEIVNE